MTTTHTLRRWGAVLIAGSLCLAVAYLFYPSTARSGLIRPAAGLALVGVLLMLPGLVVFQLSQSFRARGRVAGWIGTTLVVTGIAALEIPHTVAGAFDPSRLYDLDAWHSGIFGTLAFLGLDVLGLGLVVLAVAIFRAGVHPRWVGWAIVANIVVSLLGVLIPPLTDVIRTPAPSYFLVAALGLSMLGLAERGTRNEPVHEKVADPAPVSGV